MAEACDRRGLGRAERRKDRQPFTAMFDRERIEPLPQMRRQSGAGIEDRIKLAEHMAAEFVVGFQRRQQHVVAARHVIENGLLNLAQVLQRGIELAGHRPAGIDIERAAVAQHLAEIEIGAEGVVPGQPVDQNRRPAGEEYPDLIDRLAVRAQHALGVDHAFRHAGRARGEQDFRNRVRRHGVAAPCHFRPGLHRLYLIEGHGFREIRVRRIGHHVDPGQVERLQRAPEHRKRRHIDRARPQFGDDVLQLRKILRHQRIGRRDRQERNADLHGAELEQAHMDAIVAKCGDRALAIVAVIDQPLRNGVGLAGGVAVAQTLPHPRRVAFGQERARRIGPGPMQKKLADMAGVIGERNGGAKQDFAIVAPLHRKGWRRQLDIDEIVFVRCE